MRKEGRLSCGERGMEVTRWPMLAMEERMLAEWSHLGLVIPRLVLLGEAERTKLFEAKEW